jgi:hypothetical protein
VWSGAHPCAEDLLRQFEDPWQVRSISANYQLVGREYVCSDTLLIRQADYHRMEAGLDQFMENLGAAGAADEFRHIQDEIAKLRDSLADEGISVG